MTRTHKKIATFLAITFGISSIFYYLILSAGTLEIAGGLGVLGMMWTPGFAGMVTQLIFEHSLRGMGWRLGRFKYLALAYLIPLIYCIVVYGFTWLSGLGGFPNPEMMAMISERWAGSINSPGLQLFISMLLAAIFTLPVSMISAMGEEIGWRGLFVPELAKATTFTKAALISGTVWALWHTPVIFFADYNMAGAPAWYAALMFVVMVIGISFAFAWLRLKSGSLWTAGVLHAAHNMFVQAIFTPLTVQNDITPYIIDEFGIGLALAAVVVAWVFWSKRRELPASEPAQPERREAVAPAL